jgi:alpha-mannosidase
VRSIVVKSTGRELVNPQSPYALGQYLYERFDADRVAEFTHAYVRSPTSGEMISHGKPNLPPAKDFPYRATTAADGALELRSDAVSATALLRAAPHDTIPDATHLKVTLYAGQPPGTSCAARTTRCSASTAG